MRKILRMFLVMVLATIGFNANAGTIVFADLGLENGVQYTSPFDGGDFTVQFVGGGNDGKYYLYYCGNNDNNSLRIGVAVADSITGPYKDALNHPFIKNVKI